jgi:hypothetical protein
VECDTLLAWHEKGQGQLLEASEGGHPDRMGRRKGKEKGNSYRNRSRSTGRNRPKNSN